MHLIADYAFRPFYLLAENGDEEAMYPNEIK